MIKSKRMRWTGHVASMSEKGNVYGILVRKPDGKRQGELDVGGIILNES
jgi:hypothetical protein